MKEDIHRYAKLGLVHHMLYGKELADPKKHAATLIEFFQRDDIETFDCCLPYPERMRQQIVDAIENSNKTDICFATHLFPLRKLSFASKNISEQAQIRLIVKEMIDQAALIGATGFIFASGGPDPANADNDNYRSFANFCTWLCAELKPHGITALLEPFDMTVDKKFLYGPTKKCVELIRGLEPEINNLGIELDMAHIPLMGETFEHAIRTTAPYLKRVHLGNCVFKDKANPLYGDLHPPIGFPGGEIDIEETAEILSCLLNVDFLNPDNRGNLIIEMTTWPGKTVEETIADNFNRLNKAWEMV